MQVNTPPEKQLLTITQFLEIYPISRNRFYTQVKEKHLRLTKMGNRSYVTRKDAEIWLEKMREVNLPAE